MDQIQELKDYFRKLQRIVKKEVDFYLFKYQLVKKSKIDDVLCCIYASFPHKYKKHMNTQGKRLSSVISYNLMYKILTRKFFLNSDYYIIEQKQVLNIISAIIATIERDVQYAEKNF